MLVTVLVMFGCSGGIGGGTTASSDGGNSTSNPGGGSGAGSVNSFTLNLVDADGARAVARHTTVTGTPPTATDVRVVITLTSSETHTVYGVLDTDENGNPIAGTEHDISITTTTEVFKDIQDVAYPASGNSVQIGIPDWTGYDLTLDVITSKLENTNHSILKYGHTTVVDPSTHSASITMNTVNQILTMTVPDSVISKTKFDVTLNNALPFATNYKMTMSFPNTTDVVVNTTASKCTFTAPESYTAGLDVSLQGTFTINRSFLKGAETQTQWTRLFPNAAYGEAAWSDLSPLIAVTVPL